MALNWGGADHIVTSPKHYNRRDYYCTANPFPGIGCNLPGLVQAAKQGLRTVSTNMKASPSSVAQWQF